MPVLVNSNELQAGMRLAEAFVHHGRTMVPGGKVLDSSLTESLQRRYPNQMFKVGDPILDSVVDFEDDSRERMAANKAATQISTAMADVHAKFQGRTSLGSVDFVGMQNVVADVMKFLGENASSAALLSRQLDSGSYLADHAGNVFYLSMVLGGAVRDYVVKERRRQTSAGQISASQALDLLPLGLGVMLMDVGMVPLAHLYKQEAPLTEEDRQVLREHPNVGADMIPDSMPATVKMLVRTHHENFSGSGYPTGVPGEKLHVFSRIARICDGFDAATAKQVYHGAKSPTRALWEMTVGPWAKAYDPVLMKVFTTLIQPFPIGAKLEMEDGRWAVVVRYTRGSPFKPHVVVAFDDKGERIPNERLGKVEVIGSHSALRIKSYGGEDLGYLNEITTAVDRVEEYRLDAAMAVATGQDEAAAEDRFSSLFAAAVP